MTRLSTHILDTSQGKPVRGVSVRVYTGDSEIASQITDADGRCQSLLPDGIAGRVGVYRIVFDIGGYFPNGLYPEVSITFRTTEGTPHYHIPLLVSPFGYTTYRGS